jgi:hypothetical protein
MSNHQNPLFSKDPHQVVQGFFELKTRVENLEQRRAADGQIPGYLHREFSINGLPEAHSSFAQTRNVQCVEYLTHGVEAELPRQIRLGYRRSNGYSESITYRDQYWTNDGEVCYAVEFSASKTGVLKRSASYARNGEVVHSDVTHVHLKPGKRH